MTPPNHSERNYEGSWEENRKWLFEEVGRLARNAHDDRNKMHEIQLKLDEKIDKQVGGMEALLDTSNKTILLKVENMSAKLDQFIFNTTMEFAKIRSEKGWKNSMVQLVPQVLVLGAILISYFMKK